MGSEENDAVDGGAIPKRTGATGLRERVSDLLLFDTYVGIAVLIQLVGYAALSALIPHGDYSTLVEPLQRVPVLLLGSFALVAIPALVIALVLGGTLSLLGVQPTNAVVFISIYLVGVASVWVYRKINSNLHV